jgi:2-dehydropantoate 2-reductase
MRIAVLGPGGVGGLIGGVLHRAGHEVTIVAREATAALIGERGVHVQSVIFGDFTARPRAVALLDEPVDALIVATKAAGLAPAL